MSMQASHSTRTRILVLWIAGAAVAAVVLAFIFLPRGEVLPGDPGDAEQVAQGKAVYDENCAACHGADLEGQPNWRERMPTGYLPAPPHDESGHTWHHPDQQLFAITKRGTAAFAPPGYATTMIGFGERLPDRDIWAALAYIKSRWPDTIRKQQAEISRRAGSK